MGLKQVKPSAHFVVNICGDRWKVNLFSHAKFNKLFGECMGICVYQHNINYRTINFRGPKVSRDTIAHELTHAFLSYKYFGNCKAATIEERVCEATGKSYKRLYQLTEFIYATLREAV